MTEPILVALIAVGGTVIGTLMGTISTYLIQKQDKKASIKMNRAEYLARKKEEVYLRFIDGFGEGIFATADIEKTVDEAAKMLAPILLYGSMEMERGVLRLREALYSQMREKNYDSGLIGEMFTELVFMARKELGVED